MGPILAVAAILVSGCSVSNAAVIFTENFNGYSGNQNANQVDTGLPVAFGGTIPGWIGSGFNAIHAVDQGAGDWAIMFFRDNTITLGSGVAANVAGVGYAVVLDYGTGTYAIPAQNTGASDGLIVQVLRADNSILAQQTFLPGAWGPGNRDLEAGLQGTLSYVGDGTGDVRLLVRTVNNAADRFGGSIDNIEWQSVPEPSGLLLTGLGLLGLCWIQRRRAPQAIPLPHFNFQKRWRHGTARRSME